MLQTSVEAWPLSSDPDWRLLSYLTSPSLILETNDLLIIDGCLLVSRKSLLKFNILHIHTHLSCCCANFLFVHDFFIFSWPHIHCSVVVPIYINTYWILQLSFVSACIALIFYYFLTLWKRQVLYKLDNLNLLTDFPAPCIFTYLFSFVCFTFYTFPTWVKTKTNKSVLNAGLLNVVE